VVATVSAVALLVSVALARLRSFPPLLPVMSNVTPSEQRKTVMAFFCSEGESESHSPAGFFWAGGSLLLGAAVAMRTGARTRSRFVRRLEEKAIKLDDSFKRTPSLHFLDWTSGLA
jgi:hypothetical protein